MSKKVRIRQVKSTIKRLESQKRTLEALGLRKMNSKVVKIKNSAINGMLKQVFHLVEVKELS